MDISLSAHQEKFINQQLAEGVFGCADELISEALNSYMLLIDPELMAKVNEGIERGLADVEAGRVMSSDECFEGIRDELKLKYGNNA